MKRAAFLLVLLMTVSTTGTEWFACAGWSSSAAMRHACCTRMTDHSDSAANQCCALAQQSRDQNSGQSRVMAPAPALVATIDINDSLAAALAVFAAPRDVWPPGQTIVPLYVQHHSLLI